ncbi:MAG: cytochrome b/b6 domain-containing protein [Cryobacterium sp.]|nr:cytochrome b/b6 domain-containing protein [Oligoflexia bacterium]
MQSIELIEIHPKHSRAIRWFHWVHFPLLTLLIYSGILIYWANDSYIPIPDWLAKSLHLNFRLANGLAWHFFLMWLFTLNGVAYFIYLAVTGEWKDLFPNRESFREAIQVAMHDLRLRKSAPPVTGKFNGAQRIAYTSIIFAGFGSVLTGIAIYKPVQVGWLTRLLGGYEAARLEHFILMVIFVLFFFVHIAQVIRAGWNPFRAMITGYEAS